jgi:prepilin-type processing-associated H-X9-DG protein
MNRPFSKAYTLAELLVVIAILVVLGLILIPISRSVVAQSQAAKCLQNLRNIGTGIVLYVGENQNRMPTMEAARSSRNDEVDVMDNLLAPYLAGERLFHCPSDKQIFTATGNSYFWNSALNGQPVATLNFLLFIQDLSKIPLVCDKEGWHRLSKHRVNFLYADGHVTEELQVFTIE